MRDERLLLTSQLPSDDQAPSGRPKYVNIVLAGGVVAVAWAAIFVRLSDDAPPLAQAAYRTLFAAGAIDVYLGVLLWRRRERWPARDAWPLLALSGILLAAHFWSWFASLDRTSVGSSVVIVAMQPLLAALLAAVFLHEAPTRRDYMGIVLATTGLVIIGGHDLFAGGPTELSGDGLALLGALFAAGYLTVGRQARPEVSAAMYSSSVYTIAALALWTLAAVFRPRLGGFDAPTWGYLLLLAFVPQIIGHTSLNWSLGHFRVVTVTLAIVGEPVIATVLAIPVLGERPGLGVLVGAPFILLGIAVGLGVFGWGRMPRRAAKALE